MLLAKRLQCLLLVALACGCSSEEDDAKAKCQDLIGTWCTQVIDCLDGSGDLKTAERASDLADCKKTGEAAVDCGAAVSVTDNYDACVSGIHATACAAISSAVASDTLKLPAKCDGVIEVAK